jgi:hypothetical protein
VSTTFVGILGRQLCVLTTLPIILLFRFKLRIEEFLNALIDEYL